MSLIIREKKGSQTFMYNSYDTSLITNTYFVSRFRIQNNNNNNKKYKIIKVHKA